MEIETILDGLTSESKEVREHAEERLRALGPVAVEPLFEAWKAGRIAVSDPYVFSTGVLVVGLGLCIYALLSLFAYSWVLGVFVALLVIPICVTDFLPMLRRRLRRSRERIEAKRRAIRRRADAAGRVLASLDDPKCVGPLLDHIYRTSVESNGDYPLEVAMPVEAALLRLLPTLSNEAAAELHLADRQHVRWLLHMHHSLAHPDLITALLRTIAHAGETRFLPTVTGLANSPAVSRAGMRVRDSALSCAEKLAERAEIEKRGELLLRPADVPSDALLRPAQGSSEPEPQQLLRPAEQE